MKHDSVTKAREEMTSIKFKAKGDFLHAVPAIRVRSICTARWKRKS